MAKEEGHTLDFKSKDISPASLSKTISAFANADGGELYVGITEDKKRRKVAWEGFDIPEDANGHIQIFEKLFPLGDEFSYCFLENESQDGLVLQVLVNKTAAIKKSSDGLVYLRRGAQNLKQDTPEQIRRLELNKGIVSYESETVGAELDRISNSTVIIDFLLTVVPTREPEPWLRQQQLVRNGRPTVAGVMLFDEEPQAALPKRSAIKIYRYRSSDVEGRRKDLAFDPITIEGHAYDQIQRAVAKTVEIAEGIPKLGEKGLESIRYPTTTLHEIITNAVLHRDYSITDDVHVRIFDNRIEVQSPGRLPGHVTVDNILNERFSRNGNIVRIINKFPNPPNKDIGEGLNTAFDAMKQLNLRVPEIVQRENSVVVVIRHEPLASPEEIIMAYLNKNGEITNSKAREICNIGSENKVKRIFIKLMERGMIEKVPAKSQRFTSYRKA